MSTHWQAGRFRLELNRPRVMGILNLTPDSFSDGGRYASDTEALAHAERMLKQGADILDIGAESSRPGADSLPMEQELARLVPVVTQLSRWGIPLSVDTYKPAVMRVMLDLGVDVINDIWALRWTDPALPTFTGAEVVASHPTCGICLMHMHREPRTMQSSPMEGRVAGRVRDFLQERASAVCARGVAAERIALDPGIGFGKTVLQNFELLRHQTDLVDLGYPLLAGWSRKSSLAAVAPDGALAAAPGSHPRMLPSVVAAVLAAERGARILRVHDVAETVHVLKILNAI